jgi:hypothetical protein
MITSGSGLLPRPRLSRVAEHLDAQAGHGPRKPHAAGLDNEVRPDGTKPPRESLEGATSHCAEDSHAGRTMRLLGELWRFGELPRFGELWRFGELCCFQDPCG